MGEVLPDDPFNYVADEVKLVPSMDEGFTASRTAKADLCKHYNTTMEQDKTPSEVRLPGEKIWITLPAKYRRAVSVTAPNPGVNSA